MNGLSTQRYAEIKKKHSFFTLRLESIEKNSNKLEIVKYLMHSTGKGIKEAKAAIDNLPCVIATDVDGFKAVEIQSDLLHLGAIIKFDV